MKQTSTTDSFGVLAINMTTGTLQVMLIALHNTRLLYCTRY